LEPEKTRGPPSPTSLPDARVRVARTQERALQTRAGVNRISEEQVGTGAALVRVDQRRRALEHRLELAKERFVADLGRFSSLLQQSAANARRNFVRAALALGGLVLLGLASAVIRRRRRLSVRWK
jgi:hypothetical protein